MVEATPRVRHAVVPAAGRGTRFLPATKAVPKEMLPIAGRPSIDYIVAEATEAGIEDILFVTRTGKEAIEAHYDADPALEAELARGNKTDLLAKANQYLERARVHSVRQGHPLGLGHAVLQARYHVGNAPFAVLLPDDIMHPDSPQLRQMIEAQEVLGGSVVALLKVGPELMQAYSTAAIETIEIPEGLDVAEGNLVRITAVKEKPKPDEFLSEYAVVGRYVFNPAIFDKLATLEPGAGGEYQLTDAFGKLVDVPAEEGGGLYGVIIDTPRYDTGDPLGYLEANIALALEDPATAEGLAQFIRDTAASLD